MTKRREFIIQAAAGSTVLLAGQAFAQAPMLAETDPTAVALGYVVEPRVSMGKRMDANISPG